MSINLTASLWSSLYAVTTAEWVALVVAVIGAGGLGSFYSAIIAAKRLKSDHKVQIRTVAAEEAEAAMRIMGGSVARLQDEVEALTERVRRCETNRREHAKVCPLLRGGGGD